MPVEFTSPQYLPALLLLLPWWVAVWPRQSDGVLFTRGTGWPTPSPRRSGAANTVLMLPRMLRFGGMTLLIVALADPQRVATAEELVTMGKGITLAVDVSGSMLATDMEGGASRLSVAREAAIRFAESRPYDELSLVAFAGQAITRVPPTTDRDVITAGVASLQVEMLTDGTDISAAVLTSVQRLLSSDREPRVVILLTDGAHNGNGPTPPSAARAAAAVGIRIHAISIVSPAGGGPRSAAQRRLESLMQLSSERETALSVIAETTGGRYFRASSGAALDSIYQEIDRIEHPVPTILEREVRVPLWLYLVMGALLLLVAEALLRGSRWGTVP